MQFGCFDVIKCLHKSSLDLSPTKYLSRCKIEYMKKKNSKFYINIISVIFKVENTTLAPPHPPRKYHSFYLS